MNFSALWSAFWMRVSFRSVLLAIAFIVLLAVFGIWTIFFRAPANFPVDQLVSVRSDVPLTQIAADLEAGHVIPSSFLFSAWMRVTGSDREVHAGSYIFAKPVGMLEVARRIHEGERGVESIKVTLPEGMTVREMSTVLAGSVPGFSGEAFLATADEYEGYLFPDTYFIEPGTTPEQFAARMRHTFSDKIKTIESEIGRGVAPLKDIVIMASIIEKEANTQEDQYIVSGILWNRIERDMPLQVDAVFGYIHGKSGYAPTGSDLKLDSPYNTYLYRGLPPGPIANPGLDTLRAAALPIETPYLYYLTGRDGNMYYAKTFEQHKRNRELYLD